MMIKNFLKLTKETFLIGCAIFLLIVVGYIYGKSNNLFLSNSGSQKQTPTNTLTPTPTEISIPTKATVTVEDLDKEQSCRKADEILNQIKGECGNLPFPGIDECIKSRKESAEVGCINNGNFPAGMTEAKCKEDNLAMANKMEELKPQYIQLKTKCGE